MELHQNTERRRTPVEEDSVRIAEILVGLSDINLIRVEERPLFLWRPSKDQ